MKYTPPKSLTHAIIGIVKIILTVASFFWFGWQVGLLMILVQIEINLK